MRIDALLERVVLAWALAGGVILLAIVLVTVTNVGAWTIDRVARAFGAHVSGLPGYEDFVRLAIGAAALMFLPVCQLRRGHIVVEVFTGVFPPGLRRALDGAWQVLTVAAALFLAYWMWAGMLETYRDGALSRVLGWPEWPFYLPGVVSLVLWALVALRQGMAGRAKAGAPHG